MRKNAFTPTDFVSPNGKTVTARTQALANHYRSRGFTLPGEEPVEPDAPIEEQPTPETVEPDADEATAEAPVEEPKPAPKKRAQRKTAAKKAAPTK